MKRRDVLGAMGAMFGLTLIPFGMNPAIAGIRSKKFVFVILRGGMDGLAAVPAIGDAAYASARDKVALDPAKVLSLDTTFALHPAFKDMHPLFKGGELAFVHAVGVPYMKRSHFDAQDLLENGTKIPGSVHSGWLNRAMATMGNGQALALGKTVPLVLQGGFQASAIDPLRSRDAKPRLLDMMEEMLDADPLLGTAFTQGLASREQVRDAQMGGEMSGKSQRRQRFKKSLSVLGRLMATEEGSQVAVVEFSGWDTHANQGAISGSLASRFKQLSDGLMAFREASGSAWKDTVVVVASEFGRTVRSNGTGGTDHGSGGLAMLLGGSVAGGKVHGDWPGLGPKDLYQGRDLMRTTDIRSVFKGVLQQHFLMDEKQLDREVFPNSHDILPMKGLIV